MAPEDKKVKVTDRGVKVTEEYDLTVMDASHPDGKLTKRTIEYPPTKTASDWIGQIATPFAVVVSIFALAVGIFQFNTQQSSNVHTQATQVAITQAQALDQQRQNTLDTYFNLMSDLILTNGLVTSRPGSEVRSIAAAQTATALRSLDGIRQGELIRFLWRARLILGAAPIVQIIGVNLSGMAIAPNANLSGINLIDDDLSEATLSHDNLSDADLSNVNFNNANLSGTNFSYADLLNTTWKGASVKGAILYGAYASGSNLLENLKGAIRYSNTHLYLSGLMDVNLSNAFLAGAYLININLHGSNLSGAQLQDADLTEDHFNFANLAGANLTGANLSYANLSGASLKGINLKGAFLLQAIVTAEQLKEAKSLQGATMPDGSIHP